LALVRSGDVPGEHELVAATRLDAAAVDVRDAWVDHLAADLPRVEQSTVGEAHPPVALVPPEQ
jgi:hypothetical protein